jgi:site-specific recombinase XerD
MNDFTTINDFTADRFAPTKLEGADKKAKFLGHENLNSTARYTKRTGEQLADAAERLTY